MICSHLTSLTCFCVMKYTFPTALEWLYTFYWDILFNPYSIDKLFYYFQ